MTTDYRALCAELLEALESWSPTGGGPLEGTEEQQEAALIARARAALARPELVGVTPVTELVAVFRKAASEDPDIVQIDPLWLTRAADLLEQLAQPEPVGPTDEEWEALKERVWNHYRTVGYQGELFIYDGDFDTALDDARREFTRYSRPAITPIPVSERLPEAEDCDAEGRCWWGFPTDSDDLDCWVLIADPMDRAFTRHPDAWLPATALPLPKTDEQSNA
jgi:hypothetical protein